MRRAAVLHQRKGCAVGDRPLKVSTTQLSNQESLKKMHPFQIRLNNPCSGRPHISLFSIEQQIEPSFQEKRASEKKTCGQAMALSPRVLVLPFPVQGHINPMLQFAKELSSRGLSVTFVTTVFLARTMHARLGDIQLETISDGYDDGGFLEADSPRAYHDRLEEVGSRTLEVLMVKNKNAGSPFSSLVYDTSLHWALDVAKGLGLTGAAFSTQSCAAFSIYFHVYKGRVAVPSGGSAVSFPGLPPLRTIDMPSLVFEVGSYQPILDLKLKQFSNLEKADWVLFNSTEALEREVVSFLKSLWRVKTIGPALPSCHLGRRINEDDKAYELNYYNPGEANYVEWLDSKPAGSVVYASFGSIATMAEEQMREFALGLRNSPGYFLWVVRPSEEGKLPRDYEEDNKEKGFILTWCRQLEVLSHKAVGCFVTHCGWNSVLEALCFGVPMVGIPQWTDQPTNAKFVEDVWGVGIKARADERGIVRREELEHCVNEVLGGERGKELKKKACKWRESILEATSAGGSSYKNTEDFVMEMQAGKDGFKAM